MKTIIHVNRNRLNSNRKNDTDLPVIAVRTSGMKVRYGKTVEVEGPSRIVMGQLSCGARSWIETHSNVKVKRT